MEELQRTLGRRRRAAMEEKEQDKEQGKDLEKKQDNELVSKTLSRTGSFSQGPGSPGSPGPSPFSRTKSFHSGQKVTRVSPWRGKEEQEDRRKEQEEQEDRRKEQEEKEGKKREQELAKLKEEIVGEMREEVKRAKDEILEVLRSLLSHQQ